jgi:hypothetical protein
MLHDMPLLRGQPPRYLIVGLCTIFVLVLFLFFSSHGSSDSYSFPYRSQNSVSGIFNDIYNETLGVSWSIPHVALFAAAATQLRSGPKSIQADVEFLAV